MNYIELGPTPINEECTQVSNSPYYQDMVTECLTFMKQLKRTFNKYPNNFQIKTFQHDFGKYVEVIFKYNNDDELNYSMHIENNIPENWDDISLKELNE